MRLFTLLLSACLLVTLAGCGGSDPKVDPTPTATTSPPSPSASPGVKEPKLPGYAKAATASGAASFMGYYLKLLDFAAHTGDVKTLTAVSNSGCQGCASYIELYQETYANGGWFRDNNRSAHKLDMTFKSGKEPVAEITTTISRAGGTYRQTQNSQVQETGKDSAKIGLELRYFGGAWVVYQYGTVK